MNRYKAPGVFGGPEDQDRAWEYGHPTAKQRSVAALGWVPKVGDLVWVETTFAKKAGKVAIQGGLFEGALLGADEAKALADLPGKEELRGMMLSALIGPARGLVGLLAAPGGSLARVVQAKVDRDGGGDE